MTEDFPSSTGNAEVLANVRVMRARLSHIISEYGLRSMDAMVSRYSDIDEVFEECERALGAAQGAGDCGARDAAKHLQEQLDLSVLEIQRLAKGVASINNYLCENPPRIGDATFDCEALLANYEPWPDDAQPTQGGDKGEAVAWQRFIEREAKEWLETGLIDESDKRAVTSFANWLMKVAATPQPASNAKTEALVIALQRVIGHNPVGLTYDTMEQLFASAAQAAKDLLAELSRDGSLAYAAKEPADAEAVAKAMYDWQFGAGTWDASQSSMKDHYVGLARAAISSLSSTQNSPPVPLSSLPSGESDPSVTLDWAGGEAVPSTPRGTGA